MHTGCLSSREVFQFKRERKSVQCWSRGKSEEQEPHYVRRRMYSIERVPSYEGSELKRIRPRENERGWRKKARKEGETKRDNWQTGRVHGGPYVLVGLRFVTVSGNLSSRRALKSLGNFGGVALSQNLMIAMSPIVSWHPESRPTTMRFWAVIAYLKGRMVLKIVGSDLSMSSALIGPKPYWDNRGWPSENRWRKWIDE